MLRAGDAIAARGRSAPVNADVRRRSTMDHSDVINKAFAAFAAEIQRSPSITLRAGHALDEYKQPPAFDAAIDDHSDEYLERYPWGITYLDPASWRHYLPYFIRYALVHSSVH